MFKDVITSVCSVIAVIIGCRGLTTWHRQLIATENRKVAKQIMLETLRLQDELQNIRSPMILPGEPELTEEQEVTMTYQEKLWHASAQYYEKALKQLLDKRTALHSSALEGKVLFGDEAMKVVDPLFDLVHKYWAERYMDFQMTNPRNYRRYESSERKDKSFVLYRGHSDNPFDKSIQEAVDNILEYYSKRLQIEEPKKYLLF